VELFTISSLRQGGRRRRDHH